MGAGLGGFALDVLAPVRLAASDPKGFGRLLRELGAPDLADVLSFDDVPGFVQLPGLITNIEQLVAAAQSGADDAAATAAVEAIEIFGDVMVIVEAVASWTPPPVPSGADVAGLGLDIATRLPGYLLSRFLESRAPAIHGVLLLLGVIVESTVTRSDGANSSYVEVDWAQLGDIVSGDATGIMEAFGWGGVEPWEASRFLEYLRRFLLGLRLPAQTQRLSSTFIGPAPSPFSSREAVPEDHRQLNIPIVSTRGALGFAEAGFALIPIPSTPDGVVDSLSVTNLSYGSIGGAIDVGGGWFITFQSAADATGLVQLVLSPGEPPALASADPDISVAVGVVSPAREWVVFGSADGTRLVVGGIAASVGLVLDPPEFTIGASTTPASPGGNGIEFVLDPSEGDGFISTLLGETVIEAGLDLAASWSSVDGFQFVGSGGLSITLPLSLRIGPIEFYDLELGVSFGGENGLARVAVGASLGATLGPLAVTVNGIGITGSLTIDQAASPMIRVGDIGIDLGFKSPTGLGLGLDLGVVKGGGYLNIDAPAGEYEGVLALEVLSVGISAFAIVETKNPEVDGWSLMMAIYLELPSIQLGFGFTLEGVGGLAGINRTIDAEALGAAVRSGDLNTILFPENPIAEAPLIISTLAAIFPAANDRYVFGPVIKIGWGTPSLIQASIGVVIEVPDPIRIAILGSISAVLPSPELELVALHLDVAGIIDFGAGTIAVDASLHNSHVIGFALAGDMALRASLHGQPDFLLSLGGFHPAYDPPAGFPTLRRLSLGLSAGSVFSISFECYFAITSNTLQFGAAFSIEAKISGFGIEGGAEFDALIQFDPFRLKTHIGLHIAVTAVGVDLMGVWLSGDLEGPNPWHVTGNATFKIAGLKKEINVNTVIGGSSSEAPIVSPDIAALVLAALELDDAVSVGRSIADGVMVSTPTDMVLANPSAVIAVAQNVVPIGVTFERFGNATDLDHVQFDLVVSQGGMSAGDAVKQWFSPAQLYNLGPKEKLAAPSFEQMDAGVEFGGGLAVGPAVVGTLDHEVSYLDPEHDAWVAAQPAAPEELPEVIMIGEPIMGFVLSPTTSNPLMTVVVDGGFSVNAQTYAVVDELTGTAVASSMYFGEAAMAAPSGTVVVPDFEVSA